MKMAYLVRSFNKLNQTNVGFLSNFVKINHKILLNRPLAQTVIQLRSNTTRQNEAKPPPPTTVRQKLQKAVAEYGSTVIIFHVGISLVSLGICYVLISSGVHMEKYISWLGINDDKVNKLASNAGTFAVAYAVHKVFAPVRIGITLTAAPFIVRYLRNIGILKKVK